MIGVGVETKGSKPGQLAKADAVGWTGRLGLVTLSAAGGEVLSSLSVQWLPALEDSRVHLSLAIACVVYGAVDFGRRWWTDTRHREVRG